MVKVIPKDCNTNWSFMNDFLEHINALRDEGKSIVVCGDVNTAHTSIDLARPKANEDTSGFFYPQKELGQINFYKRDILIPLDTLMAMNPTTTAGGVTEPMPELIMQAGELIISL